MWDGAKHSKGLRKGQNSLILFAGGLNLGQCEIVDMVDSKSHGPIHAAHISRLDQRYPIHISTLLSDELPSLGALNTGYSRIGRQWIEKHTYIFRAHTMQISQFWPSVRARFRFMFWLCDCTDCSCNQLRFSFHFLSTWTFFNLTSPGIAQIYWTDLLLFLLRTNYRIHFI